MTRHLLIRRFLLPMLEARFPGRGLRAGSPPDPFAVFPAIHEAVGNVSIWVDEDEVRVEIGTITHGHFSARDPSADDDIAAREVTEAVAHFLVDLFADRILLWKSSNGVSDGWRLAGRSPQFRTMVADDSTFLWSGPVPNPSRR